MIFRVLPTVYLPRPHRVRGALLTAVGLVAGRWLFGLYVTHSTVRSAYGAAGSVVVILIWAYYSALIVLSGAALAKAHYDEARASAGS